MTADEMADIEPRCQHCVFWELAPVERDRAKGVEFEAKRDWARRVLSEWGPCGVVAYIDGEYAGHLMWAPPSYVPGSVAFATAPISDDAVQLMSGWVDEQHRDGGLGRALVQTMARELSKRGDVRAVEAFADLKGEEAQCVLPADFLLALGFTTHRQHTRYPRMRMDLRTLVAWRSELESALGRLIPSRFRAPATPPAQPVGRVRRAVR